MKGNPKNQWWPVLLAGQVDESLDLNAVAGIEAGHVWAVGDQGTILFRGPSGVWTRFSSTGPGSLSCLGGGTLFPMLIGGHKVEGKNVLRWQEPRGPEPASWQPINIRQLRSVTTIFEASDEEVFIGDEDGNLARAGLDLVNRGGLALPIRDRLLSGAATDHIVVLVFSDQTFWRWRVPPPGQGKAPEEVWGAWQEVSLKVDTSTPPFNRPLRFNAAWADPLSGDVWMAGDHGAVARWSLAHALGGAGWQVSGSLGYRDLFSVHGTGADDVWVAGDDGAIYRWNGTAWKLSSSKVNAALYGIWACPEVVLAVGEAQTILEFRRT